MVRTFVKSQDEGDVTMDTERRNRGRFVALALLAVVAACSRSDDAAEQDPTPATAEAQSSEAVPEPTSTVAPESTVEATVDPLVAPTIEVETAFAEQFVAWRSCTSDYDACDAATSFADIYSGRAFDNLTTIVEERQGSGRKNTPLSPDTDSQRVDGLTFTNEERTAATIEYCSVDSRLVSVVNDIGEDEIFDDTAVHESGLAFYELGPDGIWRLVEFDVLLRSSEDPLCDE